jgi:hypothetical protein
MLPPGLNGKVSRVGSAEMDEAGPMPWDWRRAGAPPFPIRTFQAKWLMGSSDLIHPPNRNGGFAHNMHLTKFPYLAVAYRIPTDRFGRYGTGSRLGGRAGARMPYGSCDMVNAILMPVPANIGHGAKSAAMGQFDQCDLK